MQFLMVEGSGSHTATPMSDLLSQACSRLEPVFDRLNLSRDARCRLLGPAFSGRVSLVLRMGMAACLDVVRRIGQAVQERGHCSFVAERE